VLSDTSYRIFSDFEVTVDSFNMEVFYKHIPLDRNVVFNNKGDNVVMGFVSTQSVYGKEALILSRDQRMLLLLMAFSQKHIAADEVLMNQ
jgi:hypothetical protein